MDGVSSKLYANTISSETIVTVFLKHKDCIRGLHSTADISVLVISCKCFSKCLKNLLGAEQYQV